MLNSCQTCKKNLHVHCQLGLPRRLINRFVIDLIDFKRKIFKTFVNAF